jgi:hypothetical protein
VRVRVPNLCATPTPRFVKSMLMRSRLRHATRYPTTTPHTVRCHILSLCTRAQAPRTAPTQYLCLCLCRVRPLSGAPGVYCNLYVHICAVRPAPAAACDDCEM